MTWKAIIGFAKKAGKITIGRKATLNGIKKGKVCLALLARDAGSSIYREVLEHAKKSGIELLIVSSKEELGNAIGRKICSVLGLTDWRMAQGVMPFEQNKGLRASKNNRSFYQGAHGQTQGFGSGSENTHEHDRQGNR